MIRSEGPSHASQHGGLLNSRVLRLDTPHPDGIELRATSGQNEALMDYTIAREGAFLAELARVADKIEDPRLPYRRYGVSTTSDGERIFTGKNMCGIAAIALRNGLYMAGEIKGGSIVGVRAPLHVPPYVRNGGENHYIVRPTGANSAKQPVYFDPTYAQIDRREAGSIKAITDPGSFAESYPAEGRQGFSTNRRVLRPHEEAELIKAYGKIDGLNLDMLGRLGSTMLVPEGSTRDLEHLKGYIARIQEPFFAALQHVAAQLAIQSGWSMHEGQRIFTGAELCGIASLVFREGMERAGRALAKDVDVMSIDAGLHGDAGEDDHYHIRVHTNSGPVYIDPTHGQIDPRYAGKVVVATAKDMKKLFSEHDFEGSQARWFSVLDDLDTSVLRAFFDRLGYTPQMHEQLLASLQPA